MRISDDTRAKWRQAFNAELPASIKAFAEEEQDEGVTNGGLLSHPIYRFEPMPMTTTQKDRLWMKTTRVRHIARQVRRRSRYFRRGFGPNR